MYATSDGFGIQEGEKWRRTVWRHDDENARAVRNGKCFIQCICPKCADRHDVYMLWTGRGVPRKYCGNCRPLVAGYDSTVNYEAAILAPGHSRKKGRRHEGE